MSDWKDKRKKLHKVSVYRRADDGRWAIEIFGDGKRKFEYRKSERAAKRRANVYREQFGLPTEAVPDLPAKTGTGVANYWEDALRRAVELVLDNPTEESLHSAGTVVSRLAAVATRIVEQVGEERETDGEPQGQNAQDGLAGLTTEELKRMADGN